MKGDCGCNAKTRVIDTTHSTSGRIRRRRKCTACGVRFSTLEIKVDALIPDELTKTLDEMVDFFDTGMSTYTQRIKEIANPTTQENAGYDIIEPVIKTEDEPHTEVKRHGLRLRDEVGLTLREIGEKYGLIKREES